MPARSDGDGDEKEGTVGHETDARTNCTTLRTAVPTAEEEFEELCFEYGIELDDVTTESQMLRKEHGIKDSDVVEDEEVIYRVDIPANRYDMLCLEGIARALNIFNEREKLPNFRISDAPEESLQRMTVKAETVLVRPFVVCAVLRDITFDEARYNSFIDLQDKLHQNLCRQRSLVAIGTHDLDTLQGPFTYEARTPSQIRFVPLKQEKEFNAQDLLQYYKEHDQKLKKFVPIIEDSLVYPVLYDAKGTVLSLPPIINGAHSAIKLSTKNVFIECTATDLTKAKTVLNTVVTMFSQYCADPFVVEPVIVRNALEETTMYPELQMKELDVSLEYINQSIGVSLGAEEVCKLLTKMQLPAKVSSEDHSLLKVSIPPTRSDVLHACDVMEDVAIAYGYNNIQRRIPNTVCNGKEQPLNQLTDMLRLEMAMAGYTEVLTWSLHSHDESFKFLRREDDGKVAAKISNPATVEFEVCRTTLVSGLLKTIGANKDSPLPIRLFEVQDVVLLSAEDIIGAKNHRRLGAVFCAKESGFEEIHGLLDRTMQVSGVPCEGANEKMEHRFGGAYSIRPSNDGMFFPGRQAEVICKGKVVGRFGVVHPEVLAFFGIPFPCSAVELDVEPFCFDQFYRPLL